MFHLMSLEGNPFIIRFKTILLLILYEWNFYHSLEGNPFIIRFKTEGAGDVEENPFEV